MNKFSKLEKDEKTFNHIQLYYDLIVRRTPLIEADLEIQRIELEHHLERCNKEFDATECSDWIGRNAEAFRAYINTLKVFTLFIYMENCLEYRSDIVWEIFCRMVDVFNEEKEIIMETVKLN